MRKRHSGILVVVACATQLTGCSLLHISGPCFGVGCPSRTPGEYSQYNPGANGPKASAPAPQQAQAKNTDPGVNPQATLTAKGPAGNNWIVYAIIGLIAFLLGLGVMMLLRK